MDWVFLVNPGSEAQMSSTDTHFVDVRKLDIVLKSQFHEFVEYCSVQNHVFPI